MIAGRGPAVVVRARAQLGAGERVSLGMPSRRVDTLRRLTLLAAACGVLLGTGAPAASAATDRCDARTYLSGASGHTHRHTYATVLSTSTLRVLRTRDEDSARYVVCDRRTNRAHTIAQDALAGAETTDVRNDGFVSAGRYVAFRRTASGDTNAVSVRSIDARTGHVRRSSGPVATPEGTPPSPAQVVVTATGAVGWVGPAGVYVTDANGTRNAASGEAHDLATAGHTLYWSGPDGAHATRIA